jgi:D-3-phosphoglycerate dehydrogenase
MLAFITADFVQEGLDILSPYLEIKTGGWGFTGQQLTAQELIEQMRDAEVLIVTYEPVTAAVLAAKPNLKLIGATRGGLRANIDVDAATTRGIPVIYAPGRNADAVADLTFGLMLAECRRISYTSHLVRLGKEGGWDAEGKTPVKRFKGPELGGRTVGLVGFGEVGKRVARRASGFDMRLLVYDPFVEPEVIEEAGGRMVGLETLLRESDFVTLHAAVTPQTRGLINRERLVLMKPTSYLINTARGALIDEDALIEALRDRRIAGAALDVLGEEPMRLDHPLRRLDNVTITPHIGGASDDIRTRHSRMIAEDVVRFLRGEPPLHVANPEVLKTQSVQHKRKGEP